MNHRRCCLLLVVTLAAAPAMGMAQTSAHFPTPREVGLQTINNPGGGQVLCGTLKQDSTLPAAMVTMLRTVHGYFGERPSVSQFFKAKGSDSVAAFFTENVKTKGGGAKTISGLVIVSLQPGSAPTGIAMFDDSAHFSKTQPVMLKAANDALRKEGIANAPAATTSAAAPRGAVQPLQISTGGDRSAAVGLPEGWQITGVRGGQLTATGPRGERIGMGLLFAPINDPRAPRSPYSRGNPLVASCGGDGFSTYTSVMDQQRRNNNLGPAAWQRISERELKPGTYELAFEVDLHDGAGERKGNAQITEFCTPGKPTWSMGVANATAPAAVWDAESATITAMYKSYSQDESVIRGETQKKIDQIHAVGARAKQQAADADAQRVASSQSFNQHMDNIDRQSKAFQNYQLDQQQLQVIGNDGNAYRGTVSNNAANALIQADPDHFQSVPSGSFIKGVDY